MRRTRSTASEEDYLEAILTLASRRRTVRPSDVATLLGVRRPSVSTALRRLAAKGWIRHRAYGDVQLTAAGYQRARAVAAGHRTLRDFLTLVLGCSGRTADRVACALEHAVPPRLAARLRRLIQTLRAHPTLVEQIRNEPQRNGTQELPCPKTSLRATGRAASSIARPAIACAARG